MAQAEKSKFLSKLARFVANPTTDWAALDAAKAGQKGAAPSGEGLELTQAEILAIRHQRRKDNRNIRIQEFAILRQMRAGASAPHAHSMDSQRSHPPSNVEQAEAAKVAAIQKPTLIANFSDKIDRIEQQMAEQWWDSVDKTKPLHTQIPIQKAVPKTQMLIETRIAQFDMSNEVENSDVIEFDPAMLEDLPVQPVAPVVPRFAAAPSATQPVVSPPVPVQPLSATQSYPTYAAAVPGPQGPAHSPAPISTQAAVRPPAQMAVQPAPPSTGSSAQPIQAVAQQAVVVPASVPQPVHSKTGAELHALSSVQTVQQDQTAAISGQALPSQPLVQASAPTTMPAAPAATASVASAVVPVVPVPAPILAARAEAAQPAAPARQGGSVSASPVHGSGEHVDFSADQPSSRSASTFVYRDAFTQFPPEDAHDSSSSDGREAIEGELRLHPLAEADSRSMVEAQAELYGDSASLVDIVIPPEYTPSDLPEFLNEPAILFVQGKFEQAEAQLLELARAEQMRAQMGHVENEEPHVLLALLDFYRCTEQEEKFEAASIEMVRHFDRSAPQYQGADLGAATRILSTLGSFADIDYSIQNGWRCPAELDLTDVMLLRAQLMTQPPQVLLDWQMLHAILDDAVEPLLDQFRDLAGRKIDLLMWGGEQLLACCI